MYQEVLIFLIACIVLIRSSSSAVNSVSHISRHLKLTEFVTSFFLVAIISALPETFISIISALKGDPGIGLGTVLGSNIADLTIILGLVSLVGRSMKIHSSIIKKDLYFVILATLPIVLGLDGVISRIDAVILLTAGISFIVVLLRERSYFHQPSHDGDKIFLQALIFFIAIAFMIASAEFIVSSSHSLALDLGIPSIMIGLVLTALGTTLPEFSFSLQSIRKGHADFAVGDLLGTVVVDATIVVGITALITPIAVNTFLLSIIGVFTAFAAVFAVLFMRTDSAITKNEALALVLFYFAFVVTQFLLR